MSTTTLTEKQLFVQGSLTTDIAEMIELLAVNVPGVKSCNVNASNKSLVLSIDSSKDESAIINELSSLIKTMDSSLQISTKKPANKTNKKLQGNAEDKITAGKYTIQGSIGACRCAWLRHRMAEKTGEVIPRQQQMCIRDRLQTDC